MTIIEKTTVDLLIESRKSTRAFTKETVPQELIAHILETASPAPSPSNMQPWKAYVTTGKVLEKLTAAVCDAFDNQSGEYKPEYPYYPERHFEPYLSRRRKVGYDMYRLVGIAKGDREKMHAQHRKNYEFFGAPTGIIFTIHRDLPYGNFIDYGAFLENIMLSARSHGLDTCLQAGWSDYHRIIREILSIPPEEMVLAGMAIGYSDTGSPINQLVTEREPLPVFTTFLSE